MIEDDERKRIEELLDRLAPRILKMINTIIKRDGRTVALNVASNVGTNLICTCLLMVAHSDNLDVEDVLNQLVREICEKFGKAIEDIDKEKMAQARWNTCKQIH
jgi:hypothetical protein